MTHSSVKRGAEMTSGAWGSWWLVLVLIAPLVGMYLASRLSWGTIWPFAPW